MSYNPALEPYSLGDLKLYIFSYWVIYAVFRGLCYGVNDYLQPLINRKYTIGLKTGSTPRKKKHLLYKVIFLCLGILVKVYLVIYLAILLGYCIAVSLPFLFGILSLITSLII